MVDFGTHADRRGRQTGRHDPARGLGPTCCSTPGQATSRLPLRVEQAAPPYTAIAQDNAEIGPDWKMVYASGVAAQDFEEGATSLSVHLATAAHTVELGPALVLNFGQNYDPAKLPANTP